MTTRRALTVLLTIIAGGATLSGLLCTVVYAQMHIWFPVAEMNQSMLVAGFAGILVSILCGVIYLLMWEDRMI